MVNTNINQQSLESQKHVTQYGGSTQSSGSFNATRSFQEGLSGATARALLDVMDDDLIIALLSGKQTMEQVNNQKDIGTALCSFQEQVGTKMFEDKLSQGLTGMASAGVTLGVAGITSMEADPSLEEAEQNLKGARSYKDAIEKQQVNIELAEGKPKTNTSPEQTDISEKTKIEVEQAEQAKIQGKKPLNPEDIKNRLEDLKARKSFLNSDKEAVDVSKETGEALGITDESFINTLDKGSLTDLQKSIDNRVEELQKQRNQLVSTRQSKLNTTTTLTSSFGDIFKSTGSVASGAIEKEQSDLQGQIAAGQSAQSIAQGNTNQVRGMIDKFMGEIAGITQIMAAIASAATPQ